MTDLRYPIENATNTLTRLENGAFSNLPKSVTDKTERPTLCAYCPVVQCADRDILSRTERANVAVMSCESFIPTIYFSVRAGLSGKRWNTVRLGEAWAKRLQPGQVVAIADSRSQKVLHTMSVERVVTGTVEEMLRDHSVNNHAIIHEQDKRLIGSGAKIAAERLGRILINSYGRNFATSDRRACAVYLERT